MSLAMSLMVEKYEHDKIRFRRSKMFELRDVMGYRKRFCRPRDLETLLRLQPRRPNARLRMPRD